MGTAGHARLQEGGGAREEAGLSEGGVASARAALKPVSAGRAPSEAAQPSIELSIPCAQPLEAPPAIV